MKFLFLSALMTLSLSTFAEIREAATMLQAVSAIRPGDLVVFDLDNTIMEPIQTLGSDQWYGYMLKEYAAEGRNESAAIDEAAARWSKVQKVTKVRPVEAITPSLVRYLQQKGYPVMALTARPQELMEVTPRQLSSIGVTFRDLKLAPANESGVVYRHGILSVGPKNNKGTVLKGILAKMNWTPKRIILIDDRDKNIKNMDAAFQDSGINNLNFRYGAADERVKAFNAAIVNFEWSKFITTGVLLSDEEAKAHMSSGL